MVFSQNLTNFVLLRIKEFVNGNLVKQANLMANNLTYIRSTNLEDTIFHIYFGYLPLSY